MARITKAVFPVAGLGTRFLPATKASPKEMLPIVDKPLIQYAVEEAVKAGVKELIFVNGRNKRPIPDHFDTAYELEHELELKGKTDKLKVVRDIVPPDVTCIYIRQSEALGLGHAVWLARPLVGQEPFAVLLADDLIDAGDAGCLAQMVEVFDREQCSMVAVQQVEQSKTDQYGIVKEKPLGNRLHEMEAIVEKPQPSEAPSNLGVVGRYILTPRIFDYLASQDRGAGGEIQLTDAIEHLRRDERVLAYEFEGRRFDCGDKLGYLMATVEYGVQHPELAESFKAYLHDFCKSF
ncbi:MAG: UTP--glucose-1-phosphate uridylyltransferase GalU [Gammaproteobacteria bacterium]|nr:UTP--glucose-1-phosphate uridylyltransferase GalU [Gammaproteobacteria bacterium]